MSQSSLIISVYFDYSYILWKCIIKKHKKNIEKYNSIEELKAITI